MSHAKCGEDETNVGLDAFAAQAYHRLEWSRDLLLRCQSLKKQSETKFSNINCLYEWFLAPLSLWPFNIHDLLATALDSLELGRTLSSELVLLMRVLPVPPSEKAINCATEHEHHVQAGHYENLIKVADSKFLAEERELTNSKELRSEWREIKDVYPVSEYADQKGLIRRSMIPERNLRSDFSIDWSDASQRFQTSFDAFCAKWNLYGMQGNKPLLLKLSVNLTPFGTMIFIPSYWSIDLKRDLNLRAISQLHRARVPHRQGKTIAQNRQHRRKMAEKLHTLDAEAKARGLVGEKKHAFLCANLGLHPETDPKQFSRLRKEFLMP